MTIPLGAFYFFTVLDKALCVLCDLMCLKFCFWLISMFFFSYLRFNIFYPAHEYMLDMDECLDASLVYL
jgi:hypothetical protein